MTMPADQNRVGTRVRVFDSFPQTTLLCGVVFAILWFVAPEEQSTVLTGAVLLSVVASVYFDPLESAESRLYPSLHLALGVAPAVLCAVGVPLAVSLGIAGVFQALLVAFRLRRGDRVRNRAVAKR